MESTSDQNRLRTAGRIPKETLDYLSEKRKGHVSESLWWNIPLLMIATVELALVVILQWRSTEPVTWHIVVYRLVAIFTLAYVIRSIFRRYFA
jgi:hypothetical protein